MTPRSALVKDYMTGKLVTFHPDTDVLADALHMTDDADGASGCLQGVQRGQRLVQGLAVQAAEALVDEQRLHTGVA